MTREARREGLLFPVLLTVLLLELPIGGLWLYPLMLVAIRQGGRTALLGAAQVWGLRLLLALLMAGGVGAQVVVTELVLLTFLSSIGFVFAALTFRGKSLSYAGGAAIGGSMLLLGGWVIAGFLAAPEALELRLQQDFVTPTLAGLDELAKAEDSSLETRAMIDSARAFLQQHARWVLYMVPGVMSSAILMTLWLNIWLLKVLEPGFDGLRPLRDWRPPDALIWVGVLGAILALTQVEPLMAVGLNLLLVGGTVYLLSGLGVMSFAARRWQVPQWMVLVVGIGLFFSGALPVMALLGVLDFQLDFRTRLLRSGEGSES